MRRLIALLLLPSGIVFAHEPYEITTTARLRAGALELEVTMARSTAMAIATGAKDAVPFDPAAFAALRSRFAACAGNLFAINSAGAALTLRSAAIALTVENDLEFRLVYPRPASGPLRIDAVHVPKLGQGYGDLLTVQGDHGALLGQQVLMAEETSLEVVVPAAPALSLPATAAALPRAFRYDLAAISIAVVGTLAFWLQRRTRPATLQTR